MKNPKQEIISNDTPVFVQEEIENEFDNKIEPWKEQLDKIYSQTNYIDVALDMMNKAGIPALIRHTWYFLKVNEPKNKVVVL